MKKSEAVIAEIHDIEGKISTINEQIAEHEAKKKSAEEEHTKLIHENPSHDPGPGDAFAKALDHGLRADALRKAKIDLQAQLDQAQANLGLAKLYESIVLAFREEESNFATNLKAIEMGIDAVNEKLGALSESIDVFVRGAGNPLDLLEGLIKNPQLGGLSLRAFLDGQINEASEHETGQFMHEVARKYINMANGLPRLNDIFNTWMSLSDLLDSHARRAQNLVPLRLKYHHPTPPAKPEAERGTTLRIPAKPPAKKLTWGEKKAQEARKMAALYR